jgi:uncharacterized membrane protein YoaK (UPF0700 family)
MIHGVSHSTVFSGAGEFSAVGQRFWSVVRPLALSRWLGANSLPTLLSVIAGSVDAIGFLGLGGLFTAHVTGNLVVLAAHLASGGSVATMLSVPVFVIALGFSRLFVSGLESMNLRPLRPLLSLQCLLLFSFLGFGICLGAHTDPEAAVAIIAGMLGVSSMAVQNALGQIALKGAPSTAVMTTNLTRFVMDLGQVFFGREAAGAGPARKRAGRTWPTIVGFVVGCVLGTMCEVKIGLEALALPATCALLALAVGDMDTDVERES